MRKILIILLFLFPISVLAKSKTDCNYTLLSNLKKLASNVNITYTYKIIDDNAYFDVTLTNIQSDMYFKDNSTGNIYYYSDTLNGIITIGDYNSGKVSYTVYSNNFECLDEKLAVKYVNLPFYNSFYHYDECEGKDDFKPCKRWEEYNGTYYDLVNELNQYNQDVNVIEDISKTNWLDNLVKIYIDYYYILLPLTVVLIVGIIYFVRLIRRRLNKFDI